MIDKPKTRVLPAGSAWIETLGRNSLPPTEAQTELWRSAQRGDAASCAFNESATLHVRGDLDVPMLTAALHDVVGRHEALRARFSPTGDRMIFTTQPSLPMPAIDLADRSAEAAKEKLRAWIARDAETPRRRDAFRFGEWSAGSRPNPPHYA